jgi:hypothetical protein
MSDTAATTIDRSRVTPQRVAANERRIAQLEKEMFTVTRDQAAIETQMKTVVLLLRELREAQR